MSGVGWGGGVTKLFYTIHKRRQKCSVKKALFSDIFVSQRPRVCFTLVLPSKMFYVKTDGK